MIGDYENPEHIRLLRGMTSRRRLLGGVLGLGVGALLAACGGDDDDDPEPTSSTASGNNSTATKSEPANETTATSDESSPTETDAAFPVTIDHMFGSTEITAKPERIVSVGWTEQDALLALGIVPTATTEWIGDHPGAIHPWAVDELGDGKIPEVLHNTDGFEFERIAALNPDLILALYVPFNLTEDAFNQLSQIAPTVAPPEGTPDGGISWQDLTRTVGVAVGLADEANVIVEDVDALFAEARDTNPAFIGALGLNAYPTGQGSFQAYPPPDPGGRLMADLGFEVPPEILELAGGNSWVDVSGERLDLIDIDVVLWLVDNFAMRDELLGDPLCQQLDVAHEGRHVFLSYDDTPDLAAATSIQTVLSLPFLLGELVPMLAAAIDGDPATEAQQSDSAGSEPTATGELDTRTIETIFGAVEVPANPQRVIALGEEFMLADLLDLGVRPIASTSSLPDSFYALDEFDTSGIAFLSNTEPDIERILELEPDLLIAYEYLVENIGFEILSQIAPTVAVTAANYRDTYTSIAVTFGLEARAEERLAEYDTTAREYGAEIGTSERTASVATVYSGGTDVAVWLDGPADLPQALVDMGFNLEPNTATLEVTGSLSRAYISLEQVALLTGEDLFMMQSDGVEGELENLAEVTATDLWQRIPAVQNDRVHTFDRLGYPGVAGRIRLLDDILASLGA